MEYWSISFADSKIVEVDVVRESPRSVFILDDLLVERCHLKDGIYAAIGGLKARLSAVW